MLSFAGPVDFITGVYDGLQMEKNEPMHVCENLVDLKIQGNAELWWNKTLEFDFFKTTDLFIDTVYNTHNLYVSCPEGYKLGWKSISAEKHMFLEPKNLMNNIIFNFGHIFDNLRDSIIWFENGSQGEKNGPYNTGYSMGNAVYFAFFKTNSKRNPDSSR